MPQNSYTLSIPLSVVNRSFSFDFNLLLLIKFVSLSAFFR